MNIDELKQALPVLFKAGITLLIQGHRGIGKSQSIKQYAKEKGFEFIDFRLGQMADPGDLIGLPDIITDEKGRKIASSFMIPERFLKAITYCEDNPESGAIVFFDELNRTTKDIIQAVFQMVLDHELNGVVFPKNLYFVAAMNPPTEEYTVLDFDDSAFHDRFCHIKLEPTSNDWIKYAISQDFDSKIVSFIQDDPACLEPQMKSFNLEVKPSRRSWEAVHKIQKHGAALKTERSIMEQLVIGLVGIEAAGAYYTYLKNYKETVSGVDVLNNYKKVRDLVLKHSAVETNRSDILKSVCDQIKDEVKKVESLNKTQEKNLVQYFQDIPKDLSKSLLLQLIELPAFRSTDSDKEYGLMGNVDNPGKSSKYAKELVDYFDKFTEEYSSDNEETKED